MEVKISGLAVLKSPMCGCARLEDDMQLRPLLPPPHVTSGHASDCILRDSQAIAVSFLLKSSNGTTCHGRCLYSAGLSHTIDVCTTWDFKGLASGSVKRMGMTTDLFDNFTSETPGRDFASECFNVRGRLTAKMPRWSMQRHVKR
jgi:hypothetical protein